MQGASNNNNAHVGKAMNNISYDRHYLLIS